MAISDLYLAFGYNDTYVPVVGTYDDGNGKRPVQFLYFNGNEGTLYYLTSQNELATVDVYNEQIFCVQLPNN